MAIPHRAIANRMYPQGGDETEKSNKAEMLAKKERVVLLLYAAEAMCANCGLVKIPHSMRSIVSDYSGRNGDMEPKRLAVLQEEGIQQPLEETLMAVNLFQERSQLSATSRRKSE